MGGQRRRPGQRTRVADCDVGKGQQGRSGAKGQRRRPGAGQQHDARPAFHIPHPRPANHPQATPRCPATAQLTHITHRRTHVDVLLGCDCLHQPRDQRRPLLRAVPLGNRRNSHRHGGADLHRHAAWRSRGAPDDGGVQWQLPVPLHARIACMDRTTPPLVLTPAAAGGAKQLASGNQTKPPSNLPFKGNAYLG